MRSHNGMLIVALGVVACLSACSGEYEQRKLGLDSSEAAKIKAMIADLRAAGVDGLEAVLSRDEAPDDLAALTYALLPIVQADDAQLVRVTRYGDNILSAKIALTVNGQESVTSMLLVERNKTLLWVGRQ